MMPQCIATRKHYMISMPESDGVISLITNSKILPYTVQGFCHIIFTKMLSNLSCIEQNSVVSVSGDVLMSVLIHTSILTCYVNMAALHIMMYGPSLPLVLYI